MELNKLRKSVEYGDIFKGMLVTLLLIGLIFGIKYLSVYILQNSSDISEAISLIGLSIFLLISILTILIAALTNLELCLEDVALPIALTFIGVLIYFTTWKEWIAIFILLEVLFWLDKEKWDGKGNKLVFVAWKKLDALFVASLIYTGIKLSKGLVKKAYEWILMHTGLLQRILIKLWIYTKWLFWVALIIIGISLVIYIWLRINALKYNSDKTEKKKRSKK